MELAELLTPEQKAELTALGKGEPATEQPETANQDVQDGLAQVSRRKRGGQRSSSHVGPFTHSEIADRLHDAQATAAVLSDKRMAAGIMVLVNADLAIAGYQRTLGEFVAKYEQSVPEVQAATRLGLAGDRVIASQECFKDKADATAMLAEVLFAHKPELFALASNGQPLCIRQIDNWKRAYNREVKAEAGRTDNAKAEALRSAGFVLSSADAVKQAEALGITPATLAPIEPAKPKVKRANVYDTIAAMYAVIGHQMNTASAEKQAEYRTVIFNAALSTGVDRDKLDTAIAKVLEREFLAIQSKTEKTETK